MKIIQLLAMPNDYSWQGIILGLGDDGVVYRMVQEARGWVPFIEPTILNGGESSNAKET